MALVGTAVEYAAELADERPADDRTTPMVSFKAAFERTEASDDASSNTSLAKPLSFSSNWRFHSALPYTFCAFRFVDHITHSPLHIRPYPPNSAQQANHFRLLSKTQGRIN
jgi:hypothetical protein